MRAAKISSILGLALGLLAGAPFGAADERGGGPMMVAQAPHNMAPLTPMPTEADARMQRRFPPPGKGGDLIGLPVLDDGDVTLGRVRQVVRTPQGKIRLIVSYGGWVGWGARPGAGSIAGRAHLGPEIASLA